METQAVPKNREARGFPRGWTIYIEADLVEPTKASSDLVIAWELEEQMLTRDLRAEVVAITTNYLSHRGWTLLESTEESTEPSIDSAIADRHAVMSELHHMIMGRAKTDLNDPPERNWETFSREVDLDGEGRHNELLLANETRLDIIANNPNGNEKITEMAECNPVEQSATPPSHTSDQSPSETKAANSGPKEIQKLVSEVNNKPPEFYLRFFRTLLSKPLGTLPRRPIDPEASFASLNEPSEKINISDWGKFNAIGNQQDVNDAAVFLSLYEDDAPLEKSNKSKGNASVSVQK